MIIRNQTEALCVACEMERRAIGIYERALQLAEDEQARAGIADMLEQEREHLRQFTAMRDQACGQRTAEQGLMIASLAAEALLPGGVMELSRAQGLQSAQRLYAYARDSEAEAVRTYAAFAQQCQDPAVKEAFLAIAREEGSHLDRLEATIQARQEAQAVEKQGNAQP